MGVFWYLATVVICRNFAVVGSVYLRICKVFNVIAENKDDHPKNFSFICEAGAWRISPAYDLTLCREGYRGEHATSVMGNGLPTKADLVNAGSDIKIPESRCQEIIEEIAATCERLLKG